MLYNLSQQAFHSEFRIPNFATLQNLLACSQGIMATLVSAIREGRRVIFIKVYTKLFGASYYSYVADETR